MFKPKIKIFLFVSGIILAFSGIVLSFMQAYNFNEIIRIFKGLDKNAFAYILAFLGAVSWGIYSNQIKKLQKVDDFVAMPLFFIATGLIFLIVIIVKGKFSLSEFNSIKPGFDLCYTIVFPTSTAYLCWNIAMKYGNKNLVTSVSFLIPLLSVLVIGIKYSGKFNFMIAYAAICLILGAIFSYFSIQRKKEIDPQHDRFSLKGIT
jgi:drug/metabolite transporter (DMT)-like permease